jgi:hypothetical protein
VNDANERLREAHYPLGTSEQVVLDYWKVTMRHAERIHITETMP